MSRVTLLPPRAGMQGVKDYVVSASDGRRQPLSPNHCRCRHRRDVSNRPPCWPRRLCCALRAARTRTPNWPPWKTTGWRRSTAWASAPRGWGRTTSLAVHINAMPCHIASIPLAVNLQCPPARHKAADL